MTTDDDEGGYDRLREDGWTHADITARTFLDDDGRYRGVKDEAVSTLIRVSDSEHAELMWWRDLASKVDGLPRVGSPLLGSRWRLVALT